MDMRTLNGLVDLREKLPEFSLGVFIGTYIGFTFWAWILDWIFWGLLTVIGIDERPHLPELVDFIYITYFLLMVFLPRDRIASLPSQTRWLPRR